MTLVGVRASRVDDQLARARSRLDRVEPSDLAAEVAGGAVVVDIRPEADRLRNGALPGAIVIERIHLEWRLDVTSGFSIPEAGDDVRVIVVCNEGYSSSFAAVTLQELGVHRATDLVGGYDAWKATVSPAP